VRPPDDDERFRELFRRHYPAVFAYSSRRNDPSVTQDVVAETFATAWRRLTDVPAEPRTLPWLIVVARNTTANHARSQRRFSRIASRFRPVPEEAASGAAERSDERRTVRIAMAELRPDDQEVLRLALWEELPHDQIAFVLGCSTKAVAVRLHRAKARLRTRLERALTDSSAAPLIPNGASQ
jgi:RNA polymerase sigma-70 factor (ECF subfamily)